MDVAAERPVVFDDPLQGFPGQVQPVEFGIAFLQPGDDGQRLRIVVEPAIRLHQLGKRIFAGMAERRVAEVMGQGQSLRQILIQLQRPGDGPRDLRHLQTMGEPGTKVIALVIDEDLRFVFQPAEARRLDYPVPVPLEASAGRAFRFGVKPPPTLSRIAGIRGAIDICHGHQNLCGNLPVRRIGRNVGPRCGQYSR